jgi:DNA-binding response OmpR family regulator
LFVNDDTDTTAVFKTGLTRHGFEVHAFVDPKLALQNFKADMYDLLLLDVMLKETDGFEALQQYEKNRQQYPDMPLSFA